MTSPALLALLFAAAPSGASLVPASAEAALVLEDRGAADGLRSFLREAGRRAPSLSPGEVGGQLRALAGIDLLAEPAGAGLGPGPRVLVAGAGAFALSAPVADARAARRALRDWLSLRGPVRSLRGGAPGLQAAGDRAGLVARTPAGTRLLCGSGRPVPALLALLLQTAARRKPALSRDARLSPALAAAGPLWVWLGARGPLRGAVLALSGSPRELVAKGRAVPERDALLAGSAPADCDPAGLACLRAAPGPAGRALLDLFLRGLPAQPGADSAFAARIAAGTTRFAARLDGLDAALLGGRSDSLRAARWSFASDAPLELPPGEALPFCARRFGAGLALSAPCAQPPGLAAGAGPALEGRLDLTGLDRSLARLTPLDLVRGEIAGGAYAVHLLYGPLLRIAGPLSLRGEPAKDQPEAAELELRLPLRL